MRGSDQGQGSMFSYVDLERRIPRSHPLRRIRSLMDEALGELSERFETIYASSGRPSIPPERLLRALLLQVLFSVRSERQLMEQLEYNLLFRWFVGLGIDERVWDATTFCKNRERLLEGSIAEELFAAVLSQAEDRDLLSPDHFSVDGTLIEAWASHKSFRPKDEVLSANMSETLPRSTINVGRTEVNHVEDRYKSKSGWFEGEIPSRSTRRPLRSHIDGVLAPRTSSVFWSRLMPAPQRVK